MSRNTYLRIPRLGGEDSIVAIGADAPKVAPSFERARRFTVVGHRGTIQADRRDAAIMLRYMRARIREDSHAH